MQSQCRPFYTVLKELFRHCPNQMVMRWIMGDLGETWSEITGTAGATEAAAQTYEQMVKTWIKADLGETWSQVAGAAGAAETTARTYQQAKDDPARSEEERLQARNEYRQATTRLYEALRTAKIQEHDGLWNEVMDAVQRAQIAGHTFFSLKHDFHSSDSERREAKEAYAKAKSRLVVLLAELKIAVPPEAITPTAEGQEPGPAEPSEQTPEPAISEEGQGPAEGVEATGRFLNPPPLKKARSLRNPALLPGRVVLPLEAPVFS